MISDWIVNNYIEIFGAVTGVLYVFLEIRQTIWLWPVGIMTSAVYIWVFFTGKLYADMSLQGYYLAISILGWYWWARGAGMPAEASAKAGLRAQGSGQKEDGAGQKENGSGLRAQSSGQRAEGGGLKEELKVTRLNLRTGIILSAVFIPLFAVMWLVLDRVTDSPVPVRDSFITSLSIIATWMLARKIYEHWYLWIVVNTTASFLFFTRGLYPTVILYIVYGIMSFAGLRAWRRTIRTETGTEPHPTSGL
jgi:nicotinamide mononucleotide transporter